MNPFFKKCRECNHTWLIHRAKPFEECLIIDCECTGWIRLIELEVIGVEL